MTDQNIPDRKTKKLEEIFKSVGSHRRLRIINVLFPDKELSVLDIADLIELSFRSTSKHLIKLEKSGYLHSRQAGFHKLYRIDPDPSETVEKILQLIVHSGNKK